MHTCINKILEIKIACVKIFLIFETIKGNKIEEMALRKSSLEDFGKVSTCFVKLEPTLKRHSFVVKIKLQSKSKDLLS